MHMRIQFGFLLLCSSVATLATPSASLARDFFLTIGGGYTPSANQASLANNVLFLRQVLREQHLDHRPHDVYFSDGDAPGRDLQVVDRSSVPKANQLMAEFFGSSKGLGLTYRNHHVPNVCGSNKPEQIRNWFDKVGSEMKQGDRLLLYVTAHGRKSKQRGNPHNTTIATWDNTDISMRELVSMLDQLPDGIEVITVMVQCHSGGFARFIFNGGDPEKGLSRQRRIGFFATVHDRPAAGCTPEINEASYVEYSSYFWAALVGHDRAGNVVDTCDYNRNGVVSFDEAHAYTVLTADTIDLPISTSEEFLRAHSRFGNGESSGEASTLLTNQESYALLMKLASPSQRAILVGLSEQLELSGDGRVAGARHSLTHTRSTRQTGNRNRPQWSGSKRRKDQLRRQIASDLKLRWPELSNLVNPVCVELLTTRSDAFVDAIESHRDYKQYRKLSDQSSPNIRKIRVKYERFLRIADNIALAENLRRMNANETLAEFEAIAAAEAGTLNENHLDKALVDAR